MVQVLAGTMPVTIGYRMESEPATLREGGCGVLYRWNQGSRTSSLANVSADAPVRAVAWQSG
jgi:hypothetical protein